MEENEVNLSENPPRNNNEQYPSANLLIEPCYEDYMRLQENYNKLYDKINVALAFVGVLFTIVLGGLDFEVFSLTVSDLNLLQLCVHITHIVCEVGSVALLFYSAVRLLLLLRGKRLIVFQSEAIRNDEVYNVAENQAALWLIEKYTDCTNYNRPIIAEKQKKFDHVLLCIIVGLILYGFAFVLRKVGI